MDQHDSRIADHPFGDYAVALRQHAMRRLERTGSVSACDADDIAQEVVLRFLKDPAAVVAAYADAELYAGASVASRAEDWRRGQRSQRGEGARARIGADGEIRGRRPVGSLDELLDNAGESDGPPRFPRRLVATDVDVIAERLALAAALAELGEQERLLLWLVGVDGHSVSDAARVIGQSRAHVSRRLAGARGRMAAAVPEELIAC